MAVLHVRLLCFSSCVCVLVFSVQSEARPESWRHDADEPGKGAAARRGSKCPRPSWGSGPTSTSIHIQACCPKEQRRLSGTHAQEQRQQKVAGNHGGVISFFLCSFFPVFLVFWKVPSQQTTRPWIFACKHTTNAVNKQQQPCSRVPFFFSFLSFSGCCHHEPFHCVFCLFCGAVATHAHETRSACPAHCSNPPHTLLVLHSSQLPSDHLPLPSALFAPSLSRSPPPYSKPLFET